MQVRYFAVLFCVAVAQSASAQIAGSLPILGGAPRPAAAPVKAVIDDYYGTRISDPYRYMENLKDPEVLGWLRAQDTYTRRVLAEIPGREHLLARFHELNNSAVSCSPSAPTIRRAICRLNKSK